MRRWSCINCGATERLTFYPDRCSSCGSAMVDADGVSTLTANEIDGDFYNEFDAAYDDFDPGYRDIVFVADDTFEAELCVAAAEGNRAATVWLWHAGAPQSLYQRHLIDDLLLENRIDMLMHVFSAPGLEAA